MNRYRHSRKHGCRIFDDLVYKGYEALVLENQLLRVTVLVGKGADIIEFLHKPTDVDFTSWTPQGLRPPYSMPSTAPTPRSTFFDIYEGGWQEVFPNGGPPTIFHGAEIGQHGEVSMCPWDYEIVEDTPELVAVRLVVETLKVPFRVEKIMSLRSGEARLSITEKVINLSSEAIPVMWGQHLAFGLPFLSDECFIDIAPEVEVIPHVGALNEFGRISREGSYTWPFVMSPSNQQVDLSRVPSEGVPSDIFYLKGFPTGFYAIRNLKTKLRIEVSWDHQMFPYLWYWIEGGRDKNYPWYGRHYAVGLEPFSSFPTKGLGESIVNGTAKTIGPHEDVETWLTIAVSQLEEFI